MGTLRPPPGSSPPSRSAASDRPFERKKPFRKQSVKRNMPLQISDRVRALGRQAQVDLGGTFARIDAIAEENTQ